MSIRILEYVALFYITLIRTNGIKKGDKLPPVIPIVLYNGIGTWDAPSSVREHEFNLPHELLRLQPAQEYILIT